MDLQAIKKIRRLYQVDPEFRRTLQEDPAAALVHWDLASAETANDLAGTVRRLLDLSSAEILASVLEVNLPDWLGTPPEAIVSR